MKVEINWKRFLSFVYSFKRKSLNVFHLAACKHHFAVHQEGDLSIYVDHNICIFDIKVDLQTDLLRLIVFNKVCS